MRIPVLLALALLAAAPAAAAPARALFLGFTVIDMSLGGSQEAEERRAEMIGRRLVDSLTEVGRYAFVDPAPVAEQAARYANPAHCNGCDSAFARDVGAEVAITGEVQKTSNLILHISVYLRDAETGALIGGGSADIRGNTDESWRRGLDFILERRILKD